MGVQYLDKQLLSRYITEAWKKELATDKDPSNGGRWLESGADGGKVGLYGGLTDKLASQLILDTDKQLYNPKQVVTTSAIADKRNGLAPSHTVELSHSWTNTTEVSNSHAIQLAVGAAHTMQASLDLKVLGFGFGAMGNLTLSVNFTYSWTNTTTETKSTTQTFSQSLPINVPTGKVYQAVLVATSQDVSIPFRALIYVTGSTETWFEDRVNGHYNYFVDAGTMFSWINKYGTAGAESSMYGSEGSQGTITTSGNLSSQQLSNFVARIYDVTDSYVDTIVQPRARTALATPSLQHLNELGKLVDEIKF